MTYLLDATAVIDLVAEGPGHRYVDSLFPDVQVSAVNWLEVLRWAQQQDVPPEDWAPDLLAYGLDVVPFTIDDAQHGPALRKAEQEVRAGRAAQAWRGLSTADIACLATAAARNLVAVTDDNLTGLVADLAGIRLVDHRREDLRP